MSKRGAKAAAPMEETTEKRSKPRVRSDAQLARKRSIDRVHHQAKRVREKNQLDNIEDGTSQIQQTIQKLAEEIHQLNLVIRGGSGSPSVYNPSSQPPSLAGADNYTTPSEFESVEDPLGDAGPLSDASYRYSMVPNSCCIDGVPCPVHQPAQSLQPVMSTGMYSTQDAMADWARADYVSVACRCGIHHQTESDCFELATYSFLLRSHKGLSRGDEGVRALPRWPSIVNMLLFHDDNPISATLNSVFKRNHIMHNLPTTVAAYLMMFLFLRWRAHPDTAAYQSLPPWLLPTTVQTSIPHPLSIDFMPWPAIRDHLTQNQGKDPRQTVKLYMEHVRFNWPESRTFLARNVKNEVVLDAEFVAATYKLENWSLSKAWAEEFPLLTHLVKPQDT
ncbi:uncharacterized protein PV09_07147 [Verruconis gallopava]|uniref:BZIP domain-containing protein n=1 Tax=Verruconis gallopava TaxID=253628 RepID=A0A0D2AQF2_9PEZI|nr:uncharacterized protein PV09_07147 [Verruconis gallopava]KIW01379.1 hypothetical protein PV09_07147 [Verruconis gallopava]